MHPVNSHRLPDGSIEVEKGSPAGDKLANGFAITQRSLEKLHAGRAQCWAIRAGWGLRSLTSVLE